MCVAKAKKKTWIYERFLQNYVVLKLGILSLERSQLTIIRSSSIPPSLIKKIDPNSVRLPLKWKKQCNYVDLSSCMKGPFASFICFVSYVKSIVMKTGIRIWLFRSVFFPIQPPSRKTDKTHTYQFNWLETCFFLLILFLKCEKQKKTFFSDFQ